MTRKDYETVAACLERALNAPDSPRHEAQVRDIAQRLALEFELDNPRFDENRFFKACGLSPVPECMRPGFRHEGV